MIRLENIDEAPPMKRIKMGLIFTQFSALVISAGFGVLLYLRNLKLLPFDDHWLVFLRLWLFLILGGVFLIGIVLVRGYRSTITKSNTSTPEARRHWRRFERGVLIFLISFTFIEIIRFDVFSFIASFGPLHNFVKENQVLCWVLDRLTEGTFFLLIVYTLLKIPQYVGKLISSFDKLYMRRWRIHESVFGILWALVGGGFIFFGLDYFDQAFGALYLIIGAIFIGRDYEDVCNLRFIHHLPHNDS